MISDLVNTTFRPRRMTAIPVPVEDEWLVRRIGRLRLWLGLSWPVHGSCSVRARERFCYQLVEGTDGYEIAVLTPMAPPPS
jgi:hypothetical protein